MAYSSTSDYPYEYVRNDTKDRPFRFASFNHARKLSERTILLWSKILNNAPKAELMLKSASLTEQEERERIRERFTRYCIKPERIIIQQSQKHQSDHLKMYSMVDLALDPFPYGGATTTLDALMMGVPVITLSGEQMVGQLSSSILWHCGQSRLIAKDESEYISNSINHYRSGLKLTEQRLNLRSSIEKTPLTDARRLTSELECLYMNLIMSQRSH